MKNKRFLYLLLPVVTLSLEMLPYGAVCNFANPEGKSWRRTYSYFSLTPFCYANFAPLLTAIVTCAVLVLLLTYCFTDRHRVVGAVKALLCVGAILSLCPLLLGVSFYSLVGGLISASLIAELVLIFCFTKDKKEG